MLQLSTISFLKSLKKNNNREWFEKNRGKFELAKEDFEIFVAALLKELVKVNPALSNLKVKDCVFRIYRDVRFSKNKLPYKTNMGAYFVEGGKKSDKAGFYIQLEPGNSFIAGGNWMPEAPQLKSIRQEIDYNFADFEKILHAKSFKKLFGELSDSRLKTTPKGYDSTNPAIAHLRQTSFTAQMPVDDKIFMSKGLVKKCGSVYESVLPFLKFLNTAIS